MRVCNTYNVFLSKFDRKTNIFVVIIDIILSEYNTEIINKVTFY